MEEDLRNLRVSVNKYRDVDDRIRGLNKQLQNLREERKIIELEIVDVVKQPEFSTFEKLSINEDNSQIIIKRPTQWNTGWTLSKGKLRDLLFQHFGEGNENAINIYNFIVREVRQTSISNEFSLERILK